MAVSIAILLIAASYMALMQASAGVQIAEAPYPPSPVIKGVTFDFSSRDRRAPGSDNWAITWADDDHTYAAWGDGAAASAAQTEMEG